MVASVPYSIAFAIVPKRSMMSQKCRLQINSCFYILMLRFFVTWVFTICGSYIEQVWPSLVYTLCTKIAHTIIRKICRQTIAHKQSFNALEIFVHNSVRADYCVGSFHKLIYNISFKMSWNETEPVAIHTCMRMWAFDVRITIPDLQRWLSTTRKGICNR